MDRLPPTIIQHIYEYDNTYREKFDKVLKQLPAHCFIHNCRTCFKPYNNCCCYFAVCKTYLKLCQQIFYDKDSVYEYDLNDIIQKGFDLNSYIYIYT